MQLNGLNGCLSKHEALVMVVQVCGPSTQEGEVKRIHQLHKFKTRLVIHEKGRKEIREGEWDIGREGKREGETEGRRKGKGGR